MICSRRRWVVVILALALTAAWAACQSRSSATHSPAPGSEGAGLARMPEFTLKDISGRDVSSGQWRGKVVLVDFWATWCPPCRQEMPGFEDLYKRYRDRGLVVVGIAMDFDADQVAKFARELGVTYPLLMGTPKVQEQWGGIRGIPTTFLVDRDGRIRKTVIGFEYEEAFEKAVKELL